MSRDLKTDDPRVLDLRREVLGMMKRFDRREFLKASAVGGVVAVGAGIPSPWMRALAEGSKGDDRILVVIQMSGGNDGLNTVVPYGDEAYRKARPQLGIAADQVLKINDQLGFHPSLRGVAKLLESGRFSIVQSVPFRIDGHLAYVPAERRTRGRRLVGAMDRFDRVGGFGRFVRFAFGARAATARHGCPWRSGAIDRIGRPVPFERDPRW
jgi:hypothetical protein